MEDGRVQILCYARYKEMIRMYAEAYVVAEEEQAKWRDLIFEEQPYLSNVYPGETWKIWIVFCIDRAQIEYFNLGVNLIFRETYTLGDAGVKEKGYYITDACVGCGACAAVCPQRCIEEGVPYRIHGKYCLHCGTVMRIVLRTRLSENEKKRLVVHITKKQKCQKIHAYNDKKCE